MEKGPNGEEIFLSRPNREKNYKKKVRRPPPDRPYRITIEAGQTLLIYRWKATDKNAFKVVAIKHYPKARTITTPNFVFIGTHEEVEKKCIELGIVIERYCEAPPFEKPEEESK